MKKTTLFLSSTLLLGLAYHAAGAPRAGGSGETILGASVRAWNAPPQAAQPKQPQWSGREEYDAFQAMVSEVDVRKKVSIAEAFLQKFPNSDFKDGAYVLMMHSYVQLNDSAKAIESGQKAIEANPENLQALSYLSFVFPFVFKFDDPEATAKLSRADSDARRGLEALQKLQKPGNVTDEQFNQYVRGQRANFNSTIGFVALQRKDYAAAVNSFRTAAEDNPSDVFTFYRLGVAHVSAEPRDYDRAVWNLARSVALAKAAQNPAGTEIEKYLKQVYVSYHGNEQGLPDIITQAASSPTPPEGFKVEPMPTPEVTGNPSVDAFNQMSVPLKLGGERAQKIWDGLKGQPIELAGFIDGVEKETNGGLYLVKIDLLAQSKSADGVYDIELKDSTQPNVRNLSKGDPVRFKGTIAEYKVTPNFVLALDGEINADDIPDKPKVTAKPKPKPRPPPARRPTRRAPG